jgi:hypothetical protein
VIAGGPSAGTSPLGGTATSKRLHPERGRLATSPRYSTNTPISGFVVELVSGRRLEEATMDALTRVTQRAEKPGRLQLAIIEWQRQLIEKREAGIADEKRPEAA